MGMLVSLCVSPALAQKDSTARPGGMTDMQRRLIPSLPVFSWLSVGETTKTQLLPKLQQIISSQQSHVMVTSGESAETGGEFINLASASKVGLMGIPGCQIVNIDFAVLNEVDIYLTKQGQLIQHAAPGNLRPYSERPLRGRTPAMTLDLAADTPYELLIRVQTSGAMILPITLSKAPYLVHRSLREQMFQGVLAGLALCLMVYSFTYIMK